MGKSNIQIFVAGALTSALTAIVMPSIVERKFSTAAFRPENIGVLPMVIVLGGAVAFIAVAVARRVT